jgi:GAF domain-containing protein
MTVNASFGIGRAIHKAKAMANARALTIPSTQKLVSFLKLSLLPLVGSGGTLPEDVWLQRHRLLLGLTGIQALIIALVGPVLGYSWELSIEALSKDGTVLHTVAEGLIVALLAVLASWDRANRTLQAVLVGFGLMSSSAIFVHLSGGYIELHFHFFVMIIFLAFYQDWVPFLTGILYVAIHHGVVGVLWPEVVYNHVAAIQAPWTWAAIHAFFVLWASVGCLIGWQYNAKAYAQTAAFAQETERRRREAEELARLMQSLTETLDMAAVGERIVVSVRQLVGGKSATLRLLQPDGSLRALASSGAAFPQTPGGHSLFPGMGLTSRAIAEKRPIWSADMLKDPDISLTDEMRNYQISSGNGSMIAVPLRARERIIGALALADQTGRSYSESEVALVQTFADQAALALENARLLEETESRAQEQGALNIIANAISQSLDRDELLKIALDKVLEATRRERVSIRLKDPATGQVTLAAHRGFSQEEIDNLRQRTRHQPTEQVLTSGQPLVVNNRQEHPDTQSLLSRSFSVAWIPMKAGARVVGVLGISAGTPLPFAPREVEFLQAIGNVIGVAIENAYLFGRTKRNLEQFRVLHEIGSAITSTLDLHDLLKVFLEKIDHVLPYSASSVRLFNPDSGLLEPIACRNLDEDEWKAEQWRGGRGIPTVVFEGKAPLMVRNLQSDARLRDAQFFRKHGLVSYLGVPLIVRDEILGVLSFYTKEDREFASEEVEFLSTLASQTAIAIHNSELYEQTQASRKELEGTNQRLEKLLQEESRLYAALTPLASADTVNQMLDRITERLTEATDADAVLVRLRDGSAGDFIYAAQRGFPEEYLEATRIKLTDSATGTVFERGEAIIAADIVSDPRIKAKRQLQAGFRSCAFLPLRVANGVRGIVHLASRKPGHFREEQQAHLMAIVRQMGIAVENRELFDEISTSKIELEKSNEAKDELLEIMARQKEKLSDLNAGLQHEIAERGRARAEIAAKNRDLETLLYVTSHDLREPLRAIENFSRIVNDRYKDRLDEKGQDFMRRVIQGSQRLNRLLDDILTLSRSQRMGTPTQEVDGESIVLEAVKRLEGKIAATNASVRVAKNFHGLKVDKTWATQAVYNLIVNALKFIRESEPPDVEIAPYQPQGPGTQVVGMVVRDRGPGVAPEHAERIFQLFQRAVGRDVEGTGAGLAIVRQIAERHGGSAWVEPRQGGGSEFIITFGPGKDVEGGHHDEYGTHGDPLSGGQ